MILPFVAVLWRGFVAGSDRYWPETGTGSGGGAVDWYSMNMPIRSLAGTRSDGRFATMWPRGERAVDFPKSRRDDGQCGPAGERPGPVPYAAGRAVPALPANNASCLVDGAGRPAGTPAGRAIGTGLTISSARTRIPPRIPAPSPDIRRAMTDQSSVNRQSAAGQSPPIHPGGSGQPRHGSTPEPPPEFPAEPPVNPKRCPVDPPAIPLRIPTRNTRQRPRGNPRGEQLLPVLIRGDARSDEAGVIGLRRIPGRNFNPRIRGADH